MAGPRWAVPVAVGVLAAGGGFVAASLSVGGCDAPLPWATCTTYEVTQVAAPVTVRDAEAIPGCSVASSGSSCEIEASGTVRASIGTDLGVPASAVVDALGITGAVDLDYDVECHSEPLLAGTSYGPTVDWMRYTYTVTRHTARGESVRAETSDVLEAEHPLEVTCQEWFTER